MSGINGGCACDVKREKLKAYRKTLLHLTSDLRHPTSDAKRQTFRIIVLCLMGLAAIAFVYLVRSLLIPFAIAAVIAYLILPLVRILESRGVNRAKAILTVYTAGIILTGIFLLLFIPTLFKETRAFENILPVYSNAWTELQDYLNRLSDRVMLPAEGRQILVEMSNRIRGDLYAWMRGFAESLLGLDRPAPQLSPGSIPGILYA